MSLLARVRATVLENELILPGEPLVLGVSGGPDSLCLLHLMVELAPEYSLRLHVGHLEHGIRGVESLADAEFVNSTCHELGVTCSVEHADVPTLAAESGLTLEQAARQARYAFLARLARQVGSRTVGVAHNADDQVETVLLHLLRGTGLTGLQGMRPMAVLDETSSHKKGPKQETAPLRLIRPLLEISREEIETYCRKQRLEPRIDTTNLTKEHTRNRIRHELVPLLEDYNPRLRETLARMAASIATDNDYLQAQLGDVWECAAQDAASYVSLDLTVLRTLHASLRHGLLRKSIYHLTGSTRDIEWVHIVDACRLIDDGSVGDHLDLPQGLAITLRYDELIVYRKDSWIPRPNVPRLLSEELILSVPGQTRLPGTRWTIATECVARADLPAGWSKNPDPFVAYLAEERLGLPLRLRTRRAGDHFEPLGSHSRQSLRTYMINNKIPKEERTTLPLLLSGEEIIWLVGWRFGQRAAITPETERVVIARLKNQ